MSTSLGRLVLDLAANAAGFERDMQRVSKSTKREMAKVSRELWKAERDLDRARSKVTKLAGAITALGSVSLGVMVREFNNLRREIDGLDKTSRTVSLTVEELQELRFAAEQSGIQANTLDMAMQRFARRVGEAANDTGELNTIVKELGVELRNADGSLKSQTELLGVFADEIANAGSQQEALRIAFKLFDSEGARLVTLLRQGSGAIEDFREQARQTGSIISGETVEATVRFNDSVNILSKNLAGLRNEAFAPIIESLSNYAEFLATTQEGQELFRASVERIIDAAKTAGTIIGIGLVTNLVASTAAMAAAEIRVIRLTQQMAALRGATVATSTAFAVFTRAASVLTGPLGIAAAVLVSLAPTLFGIRKEMEAAAGATESFDDRMRRLTETAQQFTDRQIRLGLAEVNNALAESASRLEQVESDIVRYSTVASNMVDRFGEASEGVVDKLQELQREHAELTGRAEELREAQGELNRRLEQNRDTMEEAGGSTDRLTTSTIESTEAMDGHVRAFEKLYAEADSYMESIKALSVELQGPTAAAFDQYQQQLATAEMLHSNGIISLQEYTLSQMTLEEQLRQRVMPTITRYTDMLMDLATMQTAGPGGANDLGAEMERSFRDAAVNGITAGVQNAFSSMSLDDLLSASFADVGRAVGRSVTSEVGAELGRELGMQVAESFGDKLGETLGKQLPIIGNIIGKILGDWIGEKLFGEKDPILQVAGRFGFSRDPQEAIRRGDTTTTDLGEIFFRFRKIERQAQNEVISTLREFDSTLAGIIRDEGQLEAAQEALSRMKYDAEGGSISMQDMLQQRFTTILGTFDQFVESFVLEAATLEDQVQRLADVITIRSRMGIGDTMGSDDGDMVIWLAGQLARAGETVGQSFERLLTITSALDTAVALTGNTISNSRAEVMRFSDALVAAFGDDLQRLTQGLTRIFETFFTDEERLEQQAEAAREKATELLSALGLEVTEELLTESGFREAFDSLFGTLTPEMTAVLIEAGVAVSDFIDAQQGLVDLRADESVDDLAESTEDAARAARQAARDLRDMMGSIDREIMRFANASLAAYYDLRDEQIDQIRALNDLGASESQLARARQLHHLQLQEFTNDLKISILTLADELFGTEDAIESVSTGIARATTNIRDSFIRALEGIDAWLDRSLLSNISPLTPTERLGEAQAQFDAALAGAGSDPELLAALPGLADALLGEGASFFGTSTEQFRTLFDDVRAAMERASEFDPPAAMDGPPTFAQVERIETETSAFRVRLDELERMQKAWDLGGQMETLAALTGQTPAELARELGFTDANMRDLLGMLGHDIPIGTGDELAEYFNNVVGEIAAQDPLLKAIQDSNAGTMKAVEILETNLWYIGDVLVQILRQLGGEYTPFEPPRDMQFSDGGFVPRTGNALVHAGEFVVPRSGALVSNPEQTAVLERIDTRLRNLERINSGGFSGIQDEERRTRQAMTQRRETARA